MRRRQNGLLTITPKIRDWSCSKGPAAPQRPSALPMQRRIPPRRRGSSRSKAAGRRRSSSCLKAAGHFWSGFTLRLSHSRRDDLSLPPISGRAPMKLFSVPLSCSCATLLLAMRTIVLVFSLIALTAPCQAAQKPKAKAQDASSMEKRCRGLVGREVTEGTGQDSHVVNRLPNLTPRSASNFDPLERRVRAVALAPSELVGVAETARARVVW
jgi:hypothetical protein